MKTRNKGFKMPSSATLILMIIAVLAILSWFIPATSYVEGIFTSGETAKLGFLDVIYSVGAGFENRADLIAFIIALGGFMGIMMKTGTLEALVGSLLKKLNGKEILLIPILMLIFAIGGSTFGLSEETLALAVVVIPVFIVAGFDTITALMVLLIGPSIGVAASTTNPFGLGTAISAINDSIQSVGGTMEISLGEGMLLKLLAFVILYVVFTAVVMIYGKRVQKDPSKSATVDLNDEFRAKAKEKINLSSLPEMTTKRKITLGLFVAAFAFLIVGVIPWEDFNIMIFTDLGNFMSENLIARVFNGSVPQLGYWWFTEFTMLFILMAVIVGIVNGMSEKELISTFCDGAKDLFGVVVIVAVSAGVSVILTKSGLNYTILEALVNLLDGQSGILFIVLIFLVTLPLTLLIPSASGLSGTIFPIIGAAGYSISGGNSGFVALMPTAFMFGTGVFDIINPTSSVVMGLMEISEMPYERWAKVAWKLVGLKFVISLIILVILSLIII